MPTTPAEGSTAVFDVIDPSPSPTEWVRAHVNFRDDSRHTSRYTQVLLRDFPTTTTIECQSYRVLQLFAGGSMFAIFSCTYANEGGSKYGLFSYTHVDAGSRYAKIQKILQNMSKYEHLADNRLLHVSKG